MIFLAAVVFFFLLFLINKANGWLWHTVPNKIAVSERIVGKWLEFFTFHCFGNLNLASLGRRVELTTKHHLFPQYTLLELLPRFSSHPKSF